jgi:GNAT superfamily N-acetyltransferase
MGVEVDLVVRLAVLADAEAIQRLVAELDAFHAQELPSEFRVPPEPRFGSGEVAAIISNDDAGLFVVEQGGEVVGMIYLEIEEASASHRVRDPSCWVSNVVVRRDAQRQGIGRLLMEAAEAWARSKGLARVKFQVWEFNASAIALYERLGYHTVQRQMCRVL